jgi:hypothetical protein
VIRRDLLKGFLAVPMAPLAATGTKLACLPPRTLLIQPEPITTLLGRFDGVTSITRLWKNGDQAGCNLCERCTCSLTGVCNIQTTEIVSEQEAPLYDLRGVTVTSDSY